MTDAELEELISGYLNKLVEAAIDCGQAKGTNQHTRASRYHLTAVRDYTQASLLSTILALKAEVERLEGFRRDVATLLLSGDDMGDGTVFNPNDMGDQHECLESLIVKARALSALDQEDTP